MPDSSATILEPLLDGAFRLLRGGRVVMAATSSSEGIRCDGDGAVGWRLIEAPPDEAGFVLLSGNDARSEELGRTTRVTSDVGPASVLLSDGRLFAIRIRGLRPVTVELGSGEVPGAYWTARPSEVSWDIAVEPAGNALRCGPDLWCLFGAELSRWSRMEGIGNGR